MHFSLSHTHGLVAVALADSAVGIDVEGVPDARTAADIAPMLHPVERAELAALPASERPTAFARCWTRKEAYLKATGAGLTETPAATHVGSGPDPAPLPGCRLVDHTAPAGYAAATALLTPG
ncbi:hypothetical protein N566_27090 [Streptomycetaceae bacterium MP113-05]|nr:hypothetical protein N566_27090 [Streptomycetaceae bacterium MP113-05]